MEPLQCHPRPRLNLATTRSRFTRSRRITMATFRAIFCRRLTQVGLLLWKNVLFQVRRPFGTVFQIITPLTTVAVLLVLRFTVFQLTDQCFVTYNSDPLVIPTIAPFIIYYAPNTSEVNNFAINYMAPSLVKSGGSLVGVADSDDLYIAVQNNNTTRTRGCFLGGAGVYFNQFSGDDIQFSIRLRYTTVEGHWYLDSTAAKLELGGPRHVPYFYLDEGFMHLQKIVSEAIIHYRTGQPFTMNVETRQIPSPSYTRNYFVSTLDLLLPFLIGMSFVYSAGTFVKELVLEKESRTREIMKIMGLSDWVLWMTWFIKEFCFLMSICIILAVELKFGLILIHSNLLFIILFFLLFVISGVASCFLLSSFFSSATLGILAGILVWAGLYIIHFFLNPYFDNIPFAVKVLLSLLSSNFCMGFGVQVILKLEQEHRGLISESLFSSVSLTDTHFNMGIVFLILFCDAVLYMVLHWYITTVFPGQYGIRKPFYFFLLPSYWTGKKSRMRSNILEEIQMEPLHDDQRNHEREPIELPVGISIQKLNKIFNPKNKKKRAMAVTNFSLKMYKGQITALLGHNGAGKTTTMNILCGFYSATSGSACVNGLDINNDMDLIRQDLGLCPQHNILFDRLTVLEHLKFFIRLKGVTRNITEEINEMIDDLDLNDKVDVQSRNLSGGMKRKLSVALALIGGSKFVILDEPTSGMDPYTRRITWDLLIKHKHDRTILLSTQFMDEADILGDRIAIMKAGTVKTSGTSLFLKKRYGVGYHLTLEKTEADSDSSDVIAIVNSIVKNSVFLYDIGMEVSLLLPNDFAHQFPLLLNTLEVKKEDLGISSFGVSVTTMEEVFIQVGKNEDEAIERKVERRQSELLKRQSSLPETSHLETTVEEVSQVHTEAPQQQSYNTGLTLQFQQFYALFIKHIYYFSRFWLGIIFSIVLPLVSLLLSLLVAKFDSNSSQLASSLDLTFPNIAEDPNNITLFWVNMDSTMTFNFKGDNASVFHGTNFFNFTPDIKSIRSSIQNITNVNDCCNYKNQILDKFCASRLTEELNVCSNPNFGYSLCMDCLSCCHARRNKIPSCTDPTAEGLYPVSDVFCPAPPVLSITDRSIIDPTGPLDDINVYVAERLLQYSDEIGIGVFEKIFQGGFVFHSSPVSAYSTCGCENITETCQYLVPALVSSASSAPSVTFTTNDSFLNGFCKKFNESIPDCADVQYWNEKYSGTLAVCIDHSSCDVSQYQCQCSNSSQCQYSRTSPDVSSTVHTATVWYNHKAYHTAPAVLNSFYNLYLSSINPNLSLSVINDPFPIPLANEVFQLSSSIQSHSITLAVTIGLGFSLLYASITIFLTKEREEKFVGGAHGIAYWLSSYVKDGLINLFVIVTSMILFGALQVRGFTGNSLGAIFLMLTLCTWTCHSLAYVCTFVFTNALLGFTIFFILLAFPSLIMNTVVYVLIEGRKIDIEVVDFIHYVSTLHPVYGFSSGLFNLYNNGANSELCSQSEKTAAICEASNTRFASDIFQMAVPGIGHILVVLAIEAVLTTVLLILCQNGFFLQNFRRLISRKKNSTVSLIETDEDKDVSDERVAVSQVKNFKDYSIVLQNLVKEYRSVSSQMFNCFGQNTKLAVNGINLIINKGECFGLLGVNGAGKTTTFKMLTGDINISSGSAIVAGYNVSTHLRAAQQFMGYCPQFDALSELMTGRELLTMFARLKGIKENKISNEVETEIKRLNLVEYADKRCGTYSGGNKRKLSTAIALVGHPPIVLLDEPTTGMDPVTRRFVWNAITGIIKEGRSVILTSHSLEECEALCTRLTIMVNGSLKALGSVQHLKSRYSSGYLLQVKVSLEVTSSNLRRRSTRRKHKNETKQTTNTLKSDESKDIPVDEMTYKQSQPKDLQTCLRRYSFTRMLSGNSSVELPNQNINSFELATENVNTKILELFPNSSLIEKHLGHLTYEISSENTPWSEVFRLIENNKESMGILDYSISQPTLEKVFLGFAQAQQ